MNELWIDGVHVVEAGEGPALLCLHGVGSSAASFAPQFDDLAGEYRVVAWDAPGYAQSEDPAGPLDMDARVLRPASSNALSAARLRSSACRGER